MIIFIIFYVSWLLFLVLSVLVMPGFIPGVTLGQNLAYSLPISWILSLLVMLIFYFATDNPNSKKKKKE